MATIKLRHAVAIASAALFIGSGCAWFATRTIADHELRSLALAHELEVSGLCANGLKLQGTHRDDTLVVLLEQRLDSGVADATRLVDEGARLYREMPNLTDSVRRAADYYASKNYTERKASAETLLARLKNER